MGVRNLDSIFKHSSVAVVGATTKESAVGHAVLKNLVEGGFSGGLFPVNPKHSEILGLRCYPSLTEINQTAGEPVPGLFWGVCEHLAIFGEDVSFNPRPGDIGFKGDFIFDLARLDTEPAADTLVRIHEKYPSKRR
jgi:hypothetical protein